MLNLENATKLISNFINSDKIFYPFIVVILMFTFKALIETKWSDVSEVCQESNLWYYLTTIFIMCILDIKNIVSNSKNRLNNINTEFTISLGLFIWGLYEFVGIKCVNNLESTLLYKLSLSFWILSSILSCYYKIFLL